MLFKYHTRDANGNVIDGKIGGEDQEDAVRKLQERGLVVISVEAIEYLEENPIEKATEESAEEGPHSDTKECPYCAEEIKYNAVKCRFCGEMLTQEEVPEEIVETICPCCKKINHSSFVTCDSCRATLRKDNLDSTFTIMPLKEKLHLKKKVQVSKKCEIKSPTTISCPKCGCRSILTIKKGYDVGEGCCWAIFLGPLGLLCGATDANKLSNVCQKCGYAWALK